jgi:hypothetical protein
MDMLPQDPATRRRLSHAFLGAVQEGVAFPRLENLTALPGRTRDPQEWLALSWALLPPEEAAEAADEDATRLAGFRAALRAELAELDQGLAIALIPSLNALRTLNLNEANCRAPEILQALSFNRTITDLNISNNAWPSPDQHHPEDTWFRPPEQLTRLKCIYPFGDISWHEGAEFTSKLLTQVGRCQNITELALAGTGLTWQVFSQTMPTLPLRKLSLKGSIFRIGPCMGDYDWPEHPPVSDPDLLPDLFPNGSRLQTCLTSLNLSDCCFYHRAYIPGMRISSEDTAQEAQLAWLCQQLIPRGRAGAWNLKELRMLGTDPLLTPSLFLRLMLEVPRLDDLDVATKVAAIDPVGPEELYASVRAFLEGEGVDAASYNTERGTDGLYLSDEIAGRCFSQARAFAAPPTMLTVRPPSELRRNGADYIFSGLTFGADGRVLSLGDVQVAENCTAHQLLVRLREVVTLHLQVEETTRFKFIAGTRDLSSVPPNRPIQPPDNPADVCATWPFA